MDRSRREERSWGHKWVFSLSVQWGGSPGPEGWMMINPPNLPQGLHLPPDPYNWGFGFSWKYYILITVNCIPFLFQFTPPFYSFPLSILYIQMIYNCYRNPIEGRESESTEVKSSVPRSHFGLGNPTTIRLIIIISI